MRPGSLRPGSLRESADDGSLDPDAWSTAVGDLFCARSAVLRLGATIVAGDREVRVPYPDPGGAAPEYLAPDGNDPSPEMGAAERVLRPRDHKLAVELVLRNAVVDDAVRDPQLELALENDLARALADRADRAFLNGGAGGPGPRGIADVVGVTNPGADALVTVRDLVTAARAADVRFANPGWILHPETLDALSGLTTADGLAGGAGATLDSAPGLVEPDGVDGGTLLGYPFAVSTAVTEGGARRIFFAPDWSEAWFAFADDIVAIDVSGDANFGTDETVVRAVMHHDLVLRRPDGFVVSVE
ncbi:MAG TPA: phage major capsid protein [Solirubrobacteraceae bacterium]|nr:phage major capsid protein [Solirubrobacteraceae bacterium]